MSSPKSCCVTVYSKSHNDAQVRSRKGLIFWRLIVDISCKECPKRETASRLFLIIAFVSPLSCNKLSVTWNRALVGFLIFFCRFQSRKSAFFWVSLSCENTSLFVSGTDSFGQFSGTSKFFAFSFNWYRVNLICGINSTLLARLSETFEPIWQLHLLPIWLSISPVGDWSPVEWLGASSPSVSFEGLFSFVKFNVCSCCINNWASASELASKEFVEDLFCFLGLLFHVMIL